MKNSPVVREYLALNSVPEKLAFDPSGRPGAADVREDQKRIHVKMNQTRARTRANLADSRRDLPFNLRSYKTRDAVKAALHERRAGPVRHFLDRLDAYKRDIADGSPRQLFNLPIDQALPANVRRLGGWWVRQVEDVSWDNNRYSKSWHRQYGGAKSVDDRRVEFRRMTSSGPEQIAAHLKTWGGDWLARAVIEAGLAPESPSFALNIRLTKAHDAAYLYQKRGYTWYARTLLGEIVDYVIVSPLGMVYHDSDRANLVSGLHAKIRGQASQLRGVIDWAMCKKLGFCDAGIRAFCDAFGFDPRGRYSPEEIEHAVRRNPAEAAPFLGELRTLADALNYSVNWEG